MKYSYRVCLAIVKRVKQGEAISHLSKAYSVSRNEIREWVQMWDKYGCSGLKYQPHSRPTRALKEKIVRLILERGGSLTQVRVEYRICRTTLYCWVNTVRKYGYDGLEPSKRMGRPPKEIMGRPRRKNHKQSLKGYKQRICVCGQRTHY